MGAARVIAIVGVTASGKTDVAEGVAAALDGEVVCADSRQVFRDLDVGTGKPDARTRAARPHHLFDALPIERRPSAGWFAHAARAVVDDVHARGRDAVLVGGSGLYLRALQRGLAPTPPVASAVRERLRDELVALGPESLHRRLAAVDAASAARLAPADGQRITRALEVAESTGRTLTWWHGQPPRDPPDWEWRAFELRVPAETLAAHIGARARWMFDHGLIAETEALRDAGRAEPLRALRAVGYDEALALLEGALDRPAAEARTVLRTRQLAKRQRTWFRHQSDATPIELTGTDGPEAPLAAVFAALRMPHARDGAPGGRD